MLYAASPPCKRIVRRWWYPSLIFAVLNLPMALASSNESDAKTVKICSPVYASFTNEDGTGFYWDILNVIFKTHDYTFLHVISPFKRCLLSVQNHQMDGAAAAFKTKAREEIYTYPASRIHFTHYGLIYLNDYVYSGLDQLSGAIGKVRGYDFSTWLPENLEFVLLSSTQQAIKMLSKGRIKVYAEDIQDFQMTLKAMQDRSMDDYHYTVLHTNDVYSFFGQSEKGQRLAQIFDQGLQELIESGQLTQIANKYGIREHIGN